ncbi:pentapeptide repeat-containing protein [filamentous cyanobacterium LEGE 11480]|uniref:Pentapeptide repeat-containing protein n=1 Tax=Romeriopsis navalis LEGE 11480 TaxID=2777977 RepID=A0A928Z240_9CYAN|nr:V4R domain-containing protein [Romeriopsis navalis]MBE9030001.1 pentapeptide repeat-containing protein [Romeriopsis navalis LEGE 11480]
MPDSAVALPVTNQAIELLSSRYQSGERDFADYDCAELNLRATSFSYASFRRSKLRLLDWRDSNLRGIDLSDTNLSRSHLENADLRGAALDNSMLFMASLDGVNLQGADLSDASLDLTTVDHADLRGANLRGAYLCGIDLSQANLENAYFDNRTQFDQQFDPISAGMRTDITVTVDDLVAGLNQITHCTSQYIEQPLILEHWEKARFANRHLAGFSFDAAGQVVYTGNATESASFLQLKWLQLWINKFMGNCALTYSELPYIIQQDHLLVLTWEAQGHNQEHIDSVASPNANTAIFGESLAPANATNPLETEALLTVNRQTGESSIPTAQSASIATVAATLTRSPEVVVPPHQYPKKKPHYRFDDFFAFQSAQGTVKDWHGARNIFAGEDFILALIQGFEQEVGQASSLLMYDLGKAWGARDFQVFKSWFEAEFAMDIGQCPLPVVLEAWWWPFTTQGWGTWEVDLKEQANGFLFIKIFDSAVARTLGNVGKPVCHLYAGLFAGFFSQLVKQDLGCIELQCYAMGDTYCKFLVGKKERVDAATFWQTEGATARDIEMRLQQEEALTA